MDRLGPGMRACDWLTGVSTRDDSAPGLAQVESLSRLGKRPLSPSTPKLIYIVKSLKLPKYTYDKILVYLRLLWLYLAQIYHHQVYAKNKHAY